MVLTAGCRAPGRSHRPSADLSAPPTVAEADRFVRATEAALLERWRAAERADWQRMTHFSPQSCLAGYAADRALTELVGRKAAESTRFDGLALPYDTARKIRRLRTFLPLPSPRDAAERAELTRVTAALDGLWSKGRYCSKRHGGRCLDLAELDRIMASSRDPAELLDAWRGWRTVARPMRPLYERFVRLANRGARELGFWDLARLWQSRYDMSPADLEAETERLWRQVEPLYVALHCYVRARLGEVYGPGRVAPAEPIPAHLLGDMWAQSWSHLDRLLAPDRAAALDLTGELRARRVGPLDMVRLDEGLFTSLGLPPLPDSFYQRSQFVRPGDRPVACHPSAWDIDLDRDVRLSMCIRVDGQDLTTIQHELGHIYYYLAYRHQPPLYRAGANGAFDEALGDLMTLSATPGWLESRGLFAGKPPSGLDRLMALALDKVAFLPWALAVDRWRWGVFSGRIRSADYNRAWWELRRKLQGVAPPVERSEADFDPGAKYHVPGNLPYLRYFLATILQFQLHRALCRAAGHRGPLFTCSLAGKREIGARLGRVLALGASRPWPEVLEALTGQRRLDASALLEYFQPLRDWLDRQNAGRSCGWPAVRLAERSYSARKKALVRAMSCENSGSTRP